MPLQSKLIRFSLPDWLTDYISAYTPTLDVETRMAFVIEASRINVRENTGGPFAAAIFKISTGELVSLGVNRVIPEGMSILHAEMVAIAVAQKELGCYDLADKQVVDAAGCELFTSTEPCAMCFGAIPWSGVRRVVTGAFDEDARKIGFDEGPKMKDWKEQLQNREITVITNIRRDEAADVLNYYARQNGRIYNSREAG